MLHQPEAVEVRLAMRKSWFLLAPLTFWIVGWTIAGAAVIVSLVSGNLHDAGFLLIWLAVWLVAEVFAGLAWLWHVFGREIVTVSGGTLTVKRDVFGFGPARAYNTGEVRNLRALGYFGSFTSWSFGMVTWGLSVVTVQSTDGIVRSDRQTVKGLRPRATQVPKMLARVSLVLVP